MDRALVPLIGGSKQLPDESCAVKSNIVPPWQLDEPSQNPIGGGAHEAPVRPPQLHALHAAAFGPWNTLVGVEPSGHGGGAAFGNAEVCRYTYACQPAGAADTHSKPGV